MKMKFAILYLFVVFNLFAQDDNMIRVFGDSLVGKKINGETIREVHGNVVMLQGAVKITCRKAVHNISKNEAELIGNVIVTQDSITIYTDLGYYYGNSKIAFSKSGVTFFDGHVHLKAKNGFYYFDEKKAYFYRDVKLNDSVSVLTSDTLTYYDDEDKAVAVGNVMVKDTSAIIYADSLVHYRNDKITYAFRNVKIFDKSNHLGIFGNKLEDYQNQSYSKISGNPLLIKVDTTKSGKIDTLIISANLMEAFGDSSKKLIATDSVKIVRGNFASINNYSIYYQKEQHLYTQRGEDDKLPPVLWNENTQLMGDTVNIFLRDNKLEKMIITSNASIITTNPEHEFRFDQISGKDIVMYFGENGLEKTEINGNVLSIYYLYEDGEPNGLLKSSSGQAVINFKDNNVDRILFYGNPMNEYHPENLVNGNEKDFTLPAFLIIKNRPQKKDLLKNKEDLLKSFSENINEN